MSELKDAANRGGIISLPHQLDTKTPVGRKALGWLSVPTAEMVSMLGLPPLDESNRSRYSRAQLAQACVLSGLKRPLIH